MIKLGMKSSLIFAGVSLMALGASAETFNKNAVVDITRAAIVLDTTNSELDFASVVKPASGTGYLDINTSGSVVGANTTLSNTGTPSAGSFSFTGDSDAVDITVSGDGTGPTGVSLSRINLKYGTGSESSGSRAVGGSATNTLSSQTGPVHY